MSHLRYGCVLFVVLCLVGCGVPKEATVKADFLKAHPTYEVTSVVVGEGDGAAAYFHIKYRKPKDQQIYEDVWQYLDRGDGKWQLNHKETPAPPN